MIDKYIPILEARDVSKNFSGVKALIEADFSCAKGEVHALIGENGAGKSTLVKILCGVVQCDSGTFLLNGKEVKINTPTDARRLGIGAVFQELSLVPDLTVAENVYLGHELLNKYRFIDFRNMTKMTKELFENLGFTIDPEATIGDLTLAEKQLVEVAKVMSKDPEIILFDEATSALGKYEVEQLFSLIKCLVKKGKTAVFISHRMEEVEHVADRATVFRDAHHIKTIELGTVSKEQIINWIVGRKLEETFHPKKPLKSKEIALEVHGISSGHRLNGIDLQVKKGEILGIAGLQGHGQREFLRALFGAYPIDHGTVKIFGKKVVLKNPTSAIKLGITLVTDDRKNEGLLLTRSIRENLSLMILNRLRVLGLISRIQENNAIYRAVKVLDIKTPNFEQDTKYLSGGNQQKVVIGKSIITDARILLLADPTRGIDVGTKIEIYELINHLAHQGITILFYSTELSELVGLSHRVVVFKQGQIITELSKDDINEHNIINFALGIGE